MKGTVLLTRDITETATVTVEAESFSEAYDAASDLPTENLKFEVDDGYNRQAAWVTHCEAENLPMTLKQTVDAMKAEVVSLAKFGTIPWTVSSFAELHNFCDANELGGFCVDSVADEMIDRFGGRDPETDAMPDGMMEFMNAAQDAVDTWLRAGGLLAAETAFVNQTENS